MHPSALPPPLPRRHGTRLSKFTCYLSPLSLPSIPIKFMRLRSSTIYIRHTRLRILCRALRSHVLYFPRFWPLVQRIFTPIPPPVRTFDPISGWRAYACEPKWNRKKKRRKKNRFRIGMETIRDVYIYIYKR